MKYLKLFEANRFYMSKYTFEEKRDQYIEAFKSRFNKAPSKLMDESFFPTIEQAPELEDTYRHVFKCLLKSPISYLNYFTYLEDDGLVFFKTTLGRYEDVKITPLYLEQYLSRDIIQWLLELEYEENDSVAGFTKKENSEYDKLLDKIAAQAEKNIDKWKKPENFRMLPSPVRKRLDYITRGNKTNLWGMKRNENMKHIKLFENFDREEYEKELEEANKKTRDRLNGIYLKKLVDKNNLTGIKQMVDNEFVTKEKIASMSDEIMDYAAMYHNLEMVDYFIDAGADVNDIRFQFVTEKGMDWNFLKELVNRGFKFELNEIAYYLYERKPVIIEDDIEEEDIEDTDWAKYNNEFDFDDDEEIIDDEELANEKLLVEELEEDEDNQEEWDTVPDYSKMKPEGEEFVDWLLDNHPDFIKIFKDVELPKQLEKKYKYLRRSKKTGLLDLK